MRILMAMILAMSVATVARADEANKVVDQSYAGEVTANRLQLRAGPSDAYQAVATLKRGDRVVVLGKHPSSTGWLVVEVPQGYHAWVFGAFVAMHKTGEATITTDRLLVRPRPTTRYHQLNGRLDKGEKVSVVAKQETPEGVWYQIVVPRRIPLYAAGEFLRNIGAASLAEPKSGAAKPATPEVVPNNWDAEFAKLEKAVLAELPRVKTYGEIQPLRLTITRVDASKLSAPNRDRRIVLISKIYGIEREFAVAELDREERAISDELRRKLTEIEKRYREKLRRIRESRGDRQARRYTAIGVVIFQPDVFGRVPTYRLELGKRMRYFLIAPDYDLQKFVGRKVGVVGLTDPESGTGFETVMASRIEILPEDKQPAPVKK